MLKTLGPEGLAGNLVDKLDLMGTILLIPFCGISDNIRIIRDTNTSAFVPKMTFSQSVKKTE